MISKVYYVRVGIYFGTAGTKEDAEKMEADFIRMSNKFDYRFDVNTGYIIEKKHADESI